MKKAATRMTRLLGCAALASLMAAGGAPVSAEEITIALSNEASSADPHYHNLGPNNQLRRHMFESLIWQDENQILSPWLATEWRAVDETTWEFKLRDDVSFFDGSPFTARDVIYSVCRIPLVEESPSSFVVYTKAIAGMEAPDPHTLIIKTDAPYPLIPVEVSTWGVLSATANGVEGEITFDRDGCEGIGETPKTAAFNSGEAAIGTGRYKLEEFTPGEKVVLVRNEDYWGAAPPWDRVTFRPITSDGPRVAALLAGDVDVIETPPIQDLERLVQDGFTVVQGQSNRVIYLHMDHKQEPTPGVQGTDGRNPFLDRRVREAMSLAINREAIVERIMGGVAVPAGELLPPGMFGSTPDAPVTPYDPERAAALLAEAGYGGGFSLILGSPNDRYINDEKIAQAVAQMFARIGVETSVDAVTASQFFARRNNFEFSMFLAGWGSGTGEMSSPLKALLATPNKDKGMGSTNRGQYSNAEFDALLEAALATVDDGEREALLQKASQLAMADFAILPLHFEVTPWAMRKGLTYTPRADQYTIAFEIVPQTN